MTQIAKKKFEEEEHVDWLETQFELIKNVGLENYVQSQV
jgi:bacterioferritin